MALDKPKPRIGLWSALWVTLRSSALRSRVAGAVKNRAAAFFWDKAFPVLAFIGIIGGGAIALIYLFSVVVPAIGLSAQIGAQALSGSTGKLIYSAALPSVNPERWVEGVHLATRFDPDAAALNPWLIELATRPQEAKLAGSAVFGFSAQEKEKTLKIIETGRVVIATQRKRAVDSDVKDAAAALVLVRAIREGKSLEQAAQALRLARSQPSLESKQYDAQLAILNYLAAQLNKAQPLRVADLSLGRAFLPWKGCALCFAGIGASAAASPSNWVAHQAGEIQNGRHFWYGLLIVGVSLGLLIAGGEAQYRASKAVSENQDDLFQEWESQSVARATAKANAPARPKRL